MRSSIHIAAAVFLVSALGVPLLTGCGAANSIVDSNIPAINNPGGLQGNSVPVVIGTSSAESRAPIVGLDSFTGTFQDIAPVSHQSELTYIEIQQNLAQMITVTVPPGVSLPPQVTLSNIALTAKFYEAASSTSTPTRMVTFSGISGPSTALVFTEVGTTNQYQISSSASEIALGASRLTGGDAKTLVSLLTSPDSSGSTTNYVHVSMAVTADDTQLPAGSVVTFTFGQGTGHVGI